MRRETIKASFSKSTKLFRTSVCPDKLVRTFFYIAKIC